MRKLKMVRCYVRNTIQFQIAFLSKNRIRIQIQKWFAQWKLGITQRNHRWRYKKQYFFGQYLSNFE